MPLPLRSLPASAWPQVSMLGPCLCGNSCTKSIHFGDGYQERQVGEDLERLLFCTADWPGRLESKWATSWATSGGVRGLPLGMRLGASCITPCWAICVGRGSLAARLCDGVWRAARACMCLRTCDMRLPWAGEPTLVYHAGWLSAAKPGCLPLRSSVDVVAVFDGPSI